MSCRIVTVERQLTAVVKAKVPFAEIPQAQRAARAAIDAGLPSLDTGALGLTCTRWLPPQGGALDMEMGTIVARPIAAQGEIVPSELPAGRAVHSVMVGPFDGMGAAWQTLFDWIQAEKLQPAGINWEVYGPTASDPAQQETYLYALLA
ncbi:MAG: AraC family transcriptional regulator [Reyranella sp.]|uniref:GyrI-like domain-containing protein n=1 Tax=Reyranella sp. TaxID=1929291 RepID=UPI0012124F6F|nr:GyrI-like domain-containing protein [Reyranella sp.]TAJ35489.1 MAG: AraC family transcriptional regulator [Reyranella sp.]